MQLVTGPSEACAASSDSSGTSLASFHFDLPANLIAQQPAAARDQARLLVLDRRSGHIEHTRVAELGRFLHPGDLLVFNDTRVLRARLRARTESGAKIELLLVRAQAPLGATKNVWFCLGKPARRLRLGTRVTVGDGYTAEITALHGDGRYDVAFAPATDVFALLETCGEMPLPPYIRRPHGPSAADQDRYQTIFAAQPGAVAAPTAGLHFTGELIEQLRQQDVRIEKLTLHVGPGTFLPIRTDDYTHHVMEPEWCCIPESTAVAIRLAKTCGRRVIAVGTTTTRALESAASGKGEIVSTGPRWADRFIVPGDRLTVVDALFTNFHLPGSTLLLLVAAFVGRDRLLATYAEAIRREYRFYSYGDAMFIQ